MSTQIVPNQFPIPGESTVPSSANRRYKSLGLIAIDDKRPATSLAIPKVALHDISLSYRTQSGERLLALDKINLQVRAGEFVCIVGPSGCGKSTLLHLIAGLHSQTSGEITVDGKPIQGPGTDRILIFQEHGLFPWLTVGENVEFGMKMKGMPKAEREEKVR